MDNTKDDRYWKEKMNQDIQFIMEHMANMNEESFSNDEILQNAMMFRLIQISENARKLSEKFKKDNSAVPWNEMYSLRNRVVHDYGAVDLNIVYETLIYDIPELYKTINKQGGK